MCCPEFVESTSRNNGIGNEGDNGGGDNDVNDNIY